jgi:serine/threonine protein kinase
MPTYPHFRNNRLTLKMDTDYSGQDRMEIEDAVLRKLGNHPRIVTYHGRDDSTGALILETAPNGDVLSYLINHSDTSLCICAKWGLQLAEGIVYLHSKHVIWADCNPSNLLLTSDLDIHLCDFGGSSISGLRPTVCPGAAYSLPCLEWLADPNMDIFSFGSVLFEIFTLHPPHADLTRELNCYSDTFALTMAKQSTKS